MSRNYPAVYEATEKQAEFQIAFVYVMVAEGETTYWTSAEVPVSLTNSPWGNPKEFTPIPIRHSGFTETVELAPFEVEVNIAVDHSKLDNVVTRLALDKATIEIHRCQLDDNGEADFLTDTFQYFAGEVTNIRIGANIVSFTCSNFLFRPNQRLPRYYFQKTCNHIFGSPFCTIDLNTIKANATLTAFNRHARYVQFSTASVPATGGSGTSAYFQGGRIEHNSGVKLGIRTSTLSGGTFTVYLYYWDKQLESLGQAFIFPGCRKTVDVCTTFFSNLDNFGGFPYVPSNNLAADGAGKALDIGR